MKVSVMSPLDAEWLLAALAMFPLAGEAQARKQYARWLAARAYVALRRP